MATKKKAAPRRAAKVAMPPATIIIPGQSIVVGTRSVMWDHPGRADILAAIAKGQFDKIDKLLNPVAKIVSFGKNKIKVSANGEVEYDGSPVSDLLGDRIMEMAKLGLPVEPLLNFVKLTRQNPSFRAQKELYGFIDYGQLPITTKGHFLARKVVRPDFKDKHSGTVDWSPGKTVSMPRHMVDDNSSNTCSYGLHVYSREYAKFFAGQGDPLLVCEINPTNVVAVPPDYNNTKMRVCEARVIKQLQVEDDPEFFTSLVYSGGNDDGDIYADDNYDK
jgi:hypothetical protein